jgi:hypothetical protein
MANVDASCTIQASMQAALDHGQSTGIPMQIVRAGSDWFPDQYLNAGESESSASAAWLSQHPIGANG